MVRKQSASSLPAFPNNLTILKKNAICGSFRCSTPTRLVSVPVGVRNLVPGEPAEGATAGLVVEADPEGVVGTAEHQAVGEGLLEPFRVKTSPIVVLCLF